MCVWYCDAHLPPRFPKNTEHFFLRCRKIQEMNLSDRPPHGILAGFTLLKDDIDMNRQHHETTSCCSSSYLQTIFKRGGGTSYLIWRRYFQRPCLKILVIKNCFVWSSPSHPLKLPGILVSQRFSLRIEERIFGMVVLLGSLAPTASPPLVEYQPVPTSFQLRSNLLHLER